MPKIFSTRRVRALRLLDLALVISGLLLALNDLSIILFHAGFVLLAIGAFVWDLRAFLLRGIIWVGITGAVLNLNVIRGVLPADELMEIPLMVLIISIVFLIAQRRTQTEAALRLSETRYKQLVDYANDIIYRADAHGCFTFCNSTVAKLLGYTEIELLGRNYLELVAPQQRKAAAIFYGQQSAKKIPNTYRELPVLTKAGNLIWLGQNVQLIIESDRVAGFQAVARDITERKRAEAELRESENKNRALLHAIPDLIFTLSKEGVYLDCHASNPELLLIPPERFLGKRIVDVMPRRAGYLIQHRLELAIQTGVTQVSEFPLDTPRGTRHFEVRMIAYGDDKVVALTRDITERKLQEAELERRLRETTLLNRIVNAATSALEEQKVLEIACAELARGLNVPQVRATLLSADGCGLNIVAEQIPADAASAIGTVIPMTSNPATQFVLEHREPVAITNAQNDPRLAPVRDLMIRFNVSSILIVPLVIRDRAVGTFGLDAYEPHDFSSDEIALAQNVAAAVSQALDNARLYAAVKQELSERNHISAELQTQRDFALQVMSTMGQGLTVTDANGCFEYVNPAYARMVGYEPAELIGKMPDVVTLPEDLAAFDEARTLRKRGEVTTYETRLRHRDGSTVYALITGVPRWSDGRSGAIAVITDLTERKHLEHQLARARDQAMEGSRLKSEFLATMSHEIRTPMNSIIGMSEMLLGENLAAQPREFADIIHQSATALLSIINDILDFSKIEAGKMLLESIDFDLAPVIEGAVEVLAARAREKSLGLMAFVSPDIPRRLRGDPNRLRQVLLNLLGNAVKFTARGEVHVRVELRAQTPHDVTLHCAISDTGIGIPESARARLFQPFTQADGSTTRKFGGTGLGLAICKRLVEMMDGEIGVASVESIGSTFWFTARLETTDAPAQSVASLRGLRVLVVDDIKSHREIVCSYVSSWGMRGANVADGAEALSVLRQAVAAREPFDLAIVDWRMPDLDGWALARAIKHDPDLSATQLILLTAFDERGKGEEALRSGFVAYLTKPVKQSHLFDAITRVFAKDASTPSVAVRSPNQTESAPQNDQLILLAEDNPINQKVALLQLGKLGYRAQTVTTGAEAVRATLEHADTYALVLMDCQMPEMDGFEATRAIRKAELTSGRHLPIIAMTANAMEGDRDRCIAAGMDDYISKPVNLEKLGKILAAWISQEKGN
ncbi:MAG: PAS domain S-box protein [Chloroflexi bacterium]|nr:PAS domain S-box protein [Chloroflexota bacterium]